LFPWLVEHAEVVSAVTNVGMLLVWLAYLQVFVSSYRRRLRPHILISRGSGKGLDALCLICNMSAGAIYVESIIVTVDLDRGERWVSPVTDLLDLEDEEAPRDPKLRTRQGPLSTGDMRDIGTFGSLVRHVVRQQNGRESDINESIRARLRGICIEVLAAYGSEDLLVGAKRGYDFVQEDGGLRLREATVHTEQVRRRLERKRLIAALEQDR
jgi:hypothetical protein